MKAIIQNVYGNEETLQLLDIEKPVPSEKEVLVEIHAANIASGDMRINTLDVPFGLKFLMKLIFGFKGPRNKVRGITAAGEIVQIGSEVTKFKVGTPVYFINSMKAGCLAEYLVIKESAVMAKVPNAMKYREAAPLAFGAMSSYCYINEKSIKKDDKVLIYGASGSLGTYAIQLAKYYGAVVTAVSSKKNHAVTQMLGADHVIDYKTNDFTKEKKKYDVIFDAVGKLKKKDAKKVLTTNGKFLSSKMMTSEKVSHLENLNRIIEELKLSTYIDKCYSLEEYKEAHKHVYSKHKVGNVVIKIK